MAHRELRKGVFYATTIIAVVFLLLFLFVSAAYFFTIPGDQLDDQNRQALAELRSRRSIWEERRPPAYRYIVERSCICADALREPYVVTEVSGESQAEYRRPEQSREGVPGNQPPEPVSLDQLFSISEQNLVAGRQVAVEFDIRYSYPRFLRIVGEPEFPAPEIEYLVIDFEVLEY